MDAFDRIAESRIADAIERGDFDALPGRGRPLDLEDLSGVPEDLRAGYVLLKGGGYVPEELELRKRCLTLQDLIDACRDDEETRRLRSERAALLLRLEVLAGRRLRVPGRYARRLRERFA